MNGKHTEEALALLAHALKLALDNDIPSAALRAYNNMADVLNQRDRYVEAGVLLRSQLALARKVGDRVWERSAISELTFVLVQLGDWNEVPALAEEVDEDEVRDATSELLSFLMAHTDIYLHRGQLAQAEQLLSAFEGLATSSDLQNSTGFLTTLRRVVACCRAIRRGPCRCRAGNGSCQRFVWCRRPIREARIRGGSGVRPSRSVTSPRPRNSSRELNAFRVGSSRLRCVPLRERIARASPRHGDRKRRWSRLT